MWDIPEYGRFLKWGIPFFVTLGVSTLGVSTLIIMVYWRLDDLGYPLCGRPRSVFPQWNNVSKSEKSSDFSRQKGESADRTSTNSELPRGEHGQQCAGGPSVVLSIMSILCLSLHLHQQPHGLSQCPCSAWYNGVMPKGIARAFGLRGHFSNRSRPTVSSSLAAIIIRSSSASGGQNSKTSSWTFAGEAKTSWSGISTASPSRKSLCLNMVTPILATKACFTALADFPSNSAASSMLGNTPPLLAVLKFVNTKLSKIRIWIQHESWMGYATCQFEWSLIFLQCVTLW